MMEAYRSGEGTIRGLASSEVRERPEPGDASDIVARSPSFLVWYCVEVFSDELPSQL